MLFIEDVHRRMKWPVGRCTMLSAHLARAGVIGLGRVGVVRRAYRPSMKNTQKVSLHFF